MMLDVDDGEHMNGDTISIGHSDSDANLSYMSATGRDSGRIEIGMDGLSLGGTSASAGVSVGATLISLGGTSASAGETFMTPLNNLSNSVMSHSNRSSQAPMYTPFSSEMRSVDKLPTVLTINADLSRALSSESQVSDSSGEVDLSPLAFQPTPTHHKSNESMNHFIQHPLNTALIFSKPHVNTPAIHDLVRSTLQDQILCFKDAGILVEYFLPSNAITVECIDRHYQSISKFATMPIADIKIQNSAFKVHFGEQFERVVREKRIFNAESALVGCSCTPERLKCLWNDAKSTGNVKEFKTRSSSESFECAKIVIEGKTVYVINGYYLALREDYLNAESPIHILVVEWNDSDLSWNDFNMNVIGIGNPRDSKKGSLAKTISDQYERLDLSEQPINGHSVIHGSSSPLEGLAERCNWFSRDIGEDEYGRVLLGRGIPEGVIERWFTTQLESPETSSRGLSRRKDTHNIFSLVEGMGALDCTEKLVSLYDDELTDLFRIQEQASTCIDTTCCAMS